MGGIKSKIDKKYIFLYGPKHSGKTLALYTTQANMTDVIKNRQYVPTDGVNYEEIEISDAKFCLGIFDVSGDLMQYDLVNIICKSVNVSGIIFIIPLEHIDMMDLYREQLKLIINNKYIDSDNLNVLIIFNIKSDDQNKLGWIDDLTLQNKLKMQETFNKFAKGKIISAIIDVNVILQENNKFKEILLEFCNLF